MKRFISLDNIYIMIGFISFIVASFQRFLSENILFLILNFADIVKNILNIVFDLLP